MPPADFSGLSEAELRKMEEAGRVGVEARLQCLRNIQLLLDSSVVMMQQYTASAAVARYFRIAIKVCEYLLYSFQGINTFNFL